MTLQKSGHRWNILPDMVKNEVSTSNTFFGWVSFLKKYQKKTSFKTPLGSTCEDVALGTVDLTVSGHVTCIQFNLRGSESHGGDKYQLTHSPHDHMIRA